MTQLTAPIGIDARAEERHRKHLHRADELLGHAAELVDKKTMTAADRLQASEKIWGSVAHTLNAIAAGNGWEIHKASGLDSLRQYLTRESGDETITQGYLAAYAVHVNFYQDYRSPEDLKSGVVIARNLNQKLLAAAPSIKAGAKPPKNVHLLRDRSRRRSIAPSEPRQRGAIPRTRDGF